MPVCFQGRHISFPMSKPRHKLTGGSWTNFSETTTINPHSPYVGHEPLFYSLIPPTKSPNGFLDLKEVCMFPVHVYFQFPWNTIGLKEHLFFQCHKLFTILVSSSFLHQKYLHFRTIIVSALCCFLKITASQNSSKIGQLRIIFVKWVEIRKKAMLDIIAGVNPMGKLLGEL